MSTRRSAAILPLGRILAGALALLLERRSAVLHAMTLPWVVHAVLEVWLALAAASAQAALPALLLLRAAVYVLLAVSIHRLILLGPNAVPAFGMAPFGFRELRYLGWSAAQFLAAAFVLLLASPLVAISQPIGLAAGLIAAAWIVGRMALALPEIALERVVDLTSIWNLGRGAGFGLGLIVIGLPFATLVFLPLAMSGSLILRLISMTGSMLFVVFALAALALAWRHLDWLRRPGVDPAAPASVNLGPDAARGLLEVDVSGTFGARDFGHVASGDGLLPYHGRLTGLVITLNGAAWEGSERAWDALDTLLAHLGFVRVHHEHLQRVALVAPGDWQSLAERLGKHFAHAEFRTFAHDEVQSARAWCANER
ncbi:MAG: STAS/SEC14 domain-containing protein [Gammaproteobacteria bacterium]|nr:MAG: STAS/SEC14 domain-containing protein [Gammaproteobacteria bacterium]